MKKTTNNDGCEVPVQAANEKLATMKLHANFVTKMKSVVVFFFNYYSTLTHPSHLYTRFSD